MIMLYQDPTGEFVFKEADKSYVISNVMGLNDHTTSQETERERKFVKMQEKISALESSLRQYEVSFNN